MDMMFDFENMDLMIGNENTNPIERELSNMIGNVENNQDFESNPQSAQYESHENEFGHYVHENVIPRQDRVRETLEIFTNEFNMRLSQEMDSMMSIMHSQINRAINTAIAERVIPEIQNRVSSISSSGNRGTGGSSSPNSQENAEVTNGFRNKITNKDSRSTGDLRVPKDSSPYSTTICELFTFTKSTQYVILNASKGLNLEMQNSEGSLLPMFWRYAMRLSPPLLSGFVTFFRKFLKSSKGPPSIFLVFCNWMDDEKT